MIPATTRHKKVKHRPGKSLNSPLERVSVVRLAQSPPYVGIGRSAVSQTTKQTSHIFSYIYINPAIVEQKTRNPCRMLEEVTWRWHRFHLKLRLPVRFPYIPLFCIYPSMCDIDMNVIFSMFSPNDTNDDDRAPWRRRTRFPPPPQAYWHIAGSVRCFENWSIFEQHTVPHFSHVPVVAKPATWRTALYPDGLIHFDHYRFVIYESRVRTETWFGGVLLWAGV